MDSSIIVTPSGVSRQPVGDKICVKPIPTSIEVTTHGHTRKRREAKMKVVCRLLPGMVSTSVSWLKFLSTLDRPAKIDPRLIPVKFLARWEPRRNSVTLSPL